MSSRNSCIFIGKLGKNPELTFTPGGTAMVKLSIAVNMRAKKDGQWVNETEWVDAALFGKTAEFAKEWAKKGTLVKVECEYHKVKYTAKDGTTKYAVNFNAREFDILDGFVSKDEKASGNGKDTFESETESVDAALDGDFPF